MQDVSAQSPGAKYIGNRMDRSHLPQIPTLERSSRNTARRVALQEAAGNENLTLPQRIGAFDFLFFASESKISIAGRLTCLACFVLAD